MKTNTNKKNSATKKLIPAVSMLTVSAMMLSTATYAWFTMNKEVTVTGMEMSTTVTSNLLISADNVEANFTTSLNQSVSGLLEPVSTINGVNFYYTATDNVFGNGDAIEDTYTLLSGDGSSDSDFQDNYGIPSGTAAKGYIDYTFYLKADNANANTAKQIRLTDINLLDSGASVGNANAWTAAIFVHEAQAATAYTTDWAAADVISIDKMSTSLGNFTADYAVGSDGASTPTIEPMALSYGGSATTYGNSGVIASVPGGTTKYYKVAVRMWLEGEDKNCTTTIYKNNLDGYTLDLKFCFDDNHEAVTAITDAP